MEEAAKILNDLRSPIKEQKKGVQVRAKYAEMEDLKRRGISPEKDLKVKEDLVAAERELAELLIFEPPSVEMEKLCTQIMELNFELYQMKMRRKEKESHLLSEKGLLRKSSERLKDMKSKNNKLLLALQNSGADKIFEAYQWLQDHRGDLKKEVYGPVLIVVNVQDQGHAAYLENHVPNYIRKKSEILRLSDS